jgi:deoxyribose-phosphate aldolase
MNINITRNEIAQMIDHALLSPAMTDEEIIEGCQLAKKSQVASVCVKPYAVRLAAYQLQGSEVHVGTVISFPHGNASTSIKAIEAERAITDGADELDMVINIGKVLSDDWEYVDQDIREVVDLAHAKHTIVKVIFENHYLNDDQKIRLCRICAEAGVDYVKTSTGFAETGARLEDVQLMRKHCPGQVRVKAAGGIRNLDQLLQFKIAGADRIGLSATARILEEYDSRI